MVVGIYGHGPRGQGNMASQVTVTETGSQTNKVLQQILLESSDFFRFQRSLGALHYFAILSN